MFISCSIVVFPSKILCEVFGWVPERVNIAEDVLAPGDGFMVNVNFHRYVYCFLSRDSTVILV